jgi:hypothetical protein
LASAQLVCLLVSGATPPIAKQRVLLLLTGSTAQHRKVEQTVPITALEHQQLTISTATSGGGSCQSLRSVVLVYAAVAAATVAGTRHVQPSGADTGRRISTISGRQASAGAAHCTGVLQKASDRRLLTITRGVDLDSRWVVPPSGATGWDSQGPRKDMQGLRGHMQAS